MIKSTCWQKLTLDIAMRWRITDALRLKSWLSHTKLSDCDTLRYPATESTGKSTCWSLQPVLAFLQRIQCRFNGFNHFDANSKACISQCTPVGITLIATIGQRKAGSDAASTLPWVVVWKFHICKDYFQWFMQISHTNLHIGIKI